MANTIKKEEPSSINNIVVLMAVVVVLVAVISLVTTFIKISNFNKEVTGWASTYGYVNVTVNTSVSITAGPDTINWSVGYITGGVTNATLTTKGEGASVVGGNWSTTGVTGINISNVGNANCSLTVNATKNYTDWFGNGVVQPANASWNVSIKDTNSCSGGSIALNTWHQINHTAVKPCEEFNFLTDNNEVWLDVKLQVPSDTTNTNVPLTDSLTITCA